jgi:glycosyltransferase involved in cell wall biosynthesis
MNERPSVCVIGELPPPTGGMAVQALRLSEGLRSMGHRVVSVRTNPLPSSSPWRRLRILRGVINASWFLVNLLRHAPQAECLHILSNSRLSFFLFTAPAVLLGRLLGRRIVLHYHGGAAEAFLRRWRLLAMPVLKGADVIVVPSGFLGQVFTRYGLSPVEVPNVLDVAGFQFRDRVPLRPYFVVARHLQPEYNVGSALEAIAEVARDYPEARAVVAGDGVERGRLEALCDALGISARVRFVGNVSHDRMQQLYAESDIFLNSSRVDNQPVSILEAFCAGLPVISTSAGGIPLLVRHGDNGLLVSAGLPGALAEQARALLERPDLARRLIEKGLQTARCHTWEAVYPCLAKLYRSRP